MSEGVRTLELVAAASEACDEAVFRQLLQQTVFNKETLDELAEGLIFEAVSTCQSLAAADRIQIMLVHSIVAESAACSLSSGLSSGTNDGFALPSQISVTLCEALSNLLLSYNDILKVFWKEFQDAMASMQFPAAALSRNKLIFYAFLEVARLPEKYDDVHQEISLAAILYAHQVYTFESESFEDTTFEEIIRIYILSFNGEEIDSSLLSLSLPLVKNLTRVQFDAYFVPVLNDTLESLTVGSHVLEFMQTCTVFITLLTSCGKEDFLDGYMEDHGIVDILVDTCMELLIEKTSNEVVPSVSRLLSGIIQALPQRGFVLVSDALFQALNIDGEVFGDVLECRAFLKRASQCLEKVAQEGVDFKNYQREHLIDSYDQDWRDISYQMIQILKVMGDYLNSLALPAWENVYILSGGEQVLPLSDDTDTEEIRSDQISEVSEQTRSELSQDEKSTESDADSVFSSNTSLGHEISCKPLHTSNEHAAASDVKSSTSLDQEIASKLSKASNSNEHVTAAGEGTRSSTSLDQKIASKLSKVSNEHETTFDQDKSSRALDQKMASKLSKVSSEHTIFVDQDTSSSALDQKIASKLSKVSSDHAIFVDQDTSSTSLDRKIASKLTAARNPFEHAASSEVTRRSALDQKMASKLSKVSSEHTIIVDQDTSSTSLNRKIASKLTAARNPFEHAASSEVTRRALDQKMASKLSKVSSEHTIIVDQDTSISSLDQTIASKLTAARNPFEHAASSEVTSSSALDQKIASKLSKVSNEHTTIVDQDTSISSLDQTIASKVTTAHNPLQHAASSEVTSSSALDQKIASKLSKASNEHTTILDQDTSSSALDQTIASKCSPATRNPLEHAAYSTSERDLDKEVQVGNRTSVNSSSTLSDMCYSVDSMRNSRLSMSASGSSLGNLSGAHSSSERMKDRQRYSKNASLIGTNYVCDHYISDSEESTSNEDDKHAHQNVKNYDNPRHLGNKVGSKLSVLKEDKYHPSKASSRLFTASGGSGFSHGRRRNMQGFIGSSSETVDLASDIFENEEEERRIGTSSGSSMQVAAESGREAERMPLVEDQFTYDGAVVVAMAIEDGEAQEVDEAVQYDPSTKLRLNKKIQKWTLISFLAATAVTIILIVLLSKRQLEILEVDGTEAPSLAPTTASYQEIALILRDEFGPDHSYNDEDTAYGKAFDWITRDEFVLDAIENNNNGFKVDREVSIDRIHQRFLFGLFYYEMRGDSWVNCSESLAIQGGTCSYINREGEIIDGNSNWLSPLDVCAWAGINCDNSDRVIILDLSK